MAAVAVAVSLWNRRIEKDGYGKPLCCSVIIRIAFASVARTDEKGSVERTEKPS